MLQRCRGHAEATPQRRHDDTDAMPQRRRSQPIAAPAKIASPTSGGMALSDALIIAEVPVQSASMRYGKYLVPEFGRAYGERHGPKTRNLEDAL